jgi:hypothetical protein
VHTHYRNGTSLNIALHRRNGTRTVLKACTTCKEQTSGRFFTATVSYEGSYAVIKQIHDGLNDVIRHNDDKELVALEMSFKSVVAEGQHRGASRVSLLYSVSEKTLNDYPDGMYLVDLDVTLAVNEHALKLSSDKILHPYTGSERRARNINEVIGDLSKTSFLSAMTLVDNSGRGLIAPRFIRFGEHVYCIPVERSDTLTDGLHVTSRVPYSDPQYRADKFSHVHLSIEDADRLYGLCLTAEEAMRHGRNELEQAKRAADERMAELKLREMQQREASLAAAAQREEDTHRRQVVAIEKKSKLETIMMVVALLGAVSAIVGAIIKLVSLLATPVKAIPGMLPFMR